MYKAEFASDALAQGMKSLLAQIHFPLTDHDKLWQKQFMKTINILNYLSEATIKQKIDQLSL